MEEGNCTEDTPEHSDNVSKEESTTHPNTDNDNHINNSIPVYISYASEDKSKQSFTKTKKDKKDKTKYVEDLCESLTSRNINVLIYQTAVEAGDNIELFERQIGDAKIIIVILSDKYFTSPHCMYEWTLIHKHTLGKKIIYVNFDNETPIKKIYGIKIQEWDFTNPEYKNSLYDRWADYMKQCVDRYNKRNNAYPAIVQRAFSNWFYLEELNNVLQKVTDNNTLKASDDNTITNITNAVEKYIIRYNTGNDDPDLDNKITKAIWKKSVLVVGDNILKYRCADNKYNIANIQIAKDGRLGDYYNSRLFAEAIQKNNDEAPANIREWYAIHYNDRELINKLEKDKIQKNKRTKQFKE